MTMPVADLAAVGDHADLAIYTGCVVHMRLRPKVHRLGYRVFTLLADVDRLAGAGRRLRTFSYNGANLISISDRDHGPGDGTPLGRHTRQAFAEAGLAGSVVRILMLAYPRVLGTVFNPLTVYFGLDDQGALAGLIYEVNNTVGERTSYVLPAGPAMNAAGAILYAQACAKRMYVSPFTPADGRYGFRVTRPSTTALVGVHLADADGALVRTHFRGVRETATDRSLLGLLARFPMQTLRVTSAIHFEALRLRLKGVPLAERRVSPRYSVAVPTVTERAMRAKEFGGRPADVAERRSS